MADVSPQGIFRIPVVGHDTFVERINPLEDPHWDTKLTRCPGASFFHGTAWARVLHATYKFNPVYFVAETAAGDRSVLPVMEINSWLTGRRGVSLPFTDECEPICADKSSFRRIVRAAMSHADSRQWRLLELRGGKSMLGDAPASVSFFGHRLYLHKDPSVLFGRFEKAVRNAVRQAERNGLTIEFSTSTEAVNTFYALLCKTRKRHGQPPQPLRFFENIQRHALESNQGCVVLAKLGAIPVAGAVFFHFGTSAIYKYAASEESYKYLRPNNLVLWRAIEHYAGKGYESLDLGRTSRANEGLRRFKLGWGAQEHIVEYAQYDRRSGGFVTAKDQSSSWHNGVFKILPVALSRLIGAAAYRHVA